MATTQTSAAPASNTARADYAASNASGGAWLTAMHGLEGVHRAPSTPATFLREVSYLNEAATKLGLSPRATTQKPAEWLDYLMGRLQYLMWNQMALDDKRTQAYQLNMRVVQFIGAYKESLSDWPVDLVPRSPAWHIWDTPVTEELTKS